MSLTTCVPYLIGKHPRNTREPYENVGGTQDLAVTGFESRILSSPLSIEHLPISTYGTLWCGYETMSQSWARLTHTFSVGGHAGSTAQQVHPNSRCARSYLAQHPVDCLVVDRGDLHKPRPAALDDRGTFWELLILATPTETRPLLVIEFWESAASIWANGPSTKLTTTRWANLGYTSRYKVVASDSVGGAITQTRLVVARFLATSQLNWKWATMAPPGLPRPMGNLLTPPGLVPRRDHAARAPPHVKHVSDPRTDPMPWPLWASEGPWITTERGVRKLSRTELASGLGIPKHMRSDDGPFPELQRTTSVFITEYLGQCFCPPIQGPPPFETPDAVPDSLEGAVLDRLRPTMPPDPSEGTFEPYNWVPPDLSEGGTWYNDRVESLRTASAHYPGRERELIATGIDHLATHRRNYDSTGPRPTKLQLLWWEFPREHWDALREGSSMNFLVPPASVIHPNADMTTEQAEVAGKFVDELIDLGIALRPDTPVLTTAPLFCLPKPGQPEEWRVLSNMKEGGQNSVVGSDPVFLPRVSNILDCLYTNGYTAIVDASKFFYQFSTHPKDRPYLGLIHPVTLEQWVYGGLPMGSGNSPALGGRYGMAFLRLLRATSTLYQGTPRANCWWTGFTDLGYDPKLGYGLALTGPDGTPSVLVYAFVDDFLIHGPDKATVDRALRAFLDLSVQVGLLCHPKKLYPPAQVQPYIGFIFDTRGIPTIRVPTAKREKALAMVEHIRHSSPDRLFSRLALSVITGTLESLVEATPSRLGHTYLRRFHSVVHPAGSELGAATYYTRTLVPENVRRDLRWWEAILSRDISRQARSTNAGVLIPSWGDGSGTGTGGTIQIPNAPLAMWMGQWTPFVFHHSSNWKELKTLLLTLQAIQHTRPQQLDRATLFYFTDNSTTYWVCSSGSSRSPELHRLVEQIKLIELELNIELQVIHVPGVVMIQQGTDGLSRGIWASELHPYADQTQLTASIFAPCGPDGAMVDRIIHENKLPWPSWNMVHWNKAFDPTLWLHNQTVWFPPPEIARQCLCAFMEAWVESPLDTTALFFVPRVLPAFWHNLSKNITELGSIRASELRPPPPLPIPVIILYIAPHTRCLPSPRDNLDGYQPPGYREHKREAEAVRGLPPASLTT